MEEINRERELTKAFVSLADTLVGDFDTTDMLHELVSSSVELLDVDAAGLLLTDRDGTLRLMASSSESSRLLELFQLQSDEGPCLDSLDTGAQVNVPDLAAEATRWPRFSEAASERGYAAVHATPLRHGERVIGAMNLFSAQPRALSAQDLRVAQGLADVATIAILQERAIRDGEVIMSQLQSALNSRIVVEQAKGLLSSYGNVDVDEAFLRLRQAARQAGRRLAEVARDLVEGRLDLATVMAGDGGGRGEPVVPPTS